MMILPTWKEGDLIRCKQTGKPYSVIHIYKSMGTVVIDIEDTNPLTFGLVLLERDYDSYVPDLEMVRMKESNGINHFKYNPKALARY